MSLSIHLSKIQSKVIVFVKNICLFLTFLFSPVAIIVRILGLRVLDAKHHAIGHLATEPDIYLREHKLKNWKHKTILFPPYRLFHKNKFLSIDVGNRYLLNCWKDHFFVIQNPIMHIVLYPILKSPPLIYNPNHYFVQKLFNNYRNGGNAISIYQDYEKKYGEGTGYKPILRLKKNDIEKGMALMKEMGLSSNDWFVCFNCREEGYYSEYALNESSVRNAKIESYELAIKEVVSRGGWCIRMGSPSTKPLPLSFKHTRVIDYPHTKWVGEFMDIFLLSNCKFFIGTNSGLSSAAAVFGIPCVLTNVVPFGQLSIYPKDLAIFKIHRKMPDQKLLLFSQCLTSFLSVSIKSKDYEELRIEVLDNTPEEIRDVCLEMLDRLEGRFHTTPKEEELQTKFRSLMNSFCLSFESPSRVGQDFLKKHQELLN